MTRGPFIRKQSLLTTLKEYPFDLWLFLNETVMCIDWTAHAHTLGLPLGLGLKILYVYLGSRDRRSVREDIFASNVSFGRSRQASIRSAASSAVGQGLGVLLVAFCMFNAYSCFSRTRTYTFGRSLSALGSCHPVGLYARVVQMDDAACDRDAASETTNDKSRSLGQRLWALVTAHNRKAEKAPAPSTTEWWLLDVWEPLLFQLCVCIGFSPLDLAFVALVSPLDFKAIGVLLLLNASLYYICIECFLGLVRDREVIHKETFSEYDTKFVRPKLSVARTNTAIDATQGPYAQRVVWYDHSFSKEKAFFTHDRNGTLRDKYRAYKQSGSPTPTDPAERLRGHSNSPSPVLSPTPLSKAWSERQAREKSGSTLRRKYDAMHRAPNQ